MHIFVFGNPLMERDSLPLQILPGLRKMFPSVEFVELDPSEDLRALGRSPIIIRHGARNKGRARPDGS